MLKVFKYTYRLINKYLKNLVKINIIPYNGRYLNYYKN